MDRRLATGRFKTRKALVSHVMFRWQREVLWKTKEETLKLIALDAGVGVNTARKIIKQTQV